MTRDEILDKALEIIDSDGLSALSMRRLGSDLGIDPMMIYRHIPNKDALLDLTVERMRSNMVLENLPDAPSEFLEAIFVEYMRVLSSHPNMLPLAMRRPDSTEASGIQFLIDQGLPVDDAIDLFQSLTAFTVGYAFLSSPLASGKYDGVPDEIAGKLGDWTDANFRRTLRAIIGSHKLEKIGET